MWGSGDAHETPSLQRNPSGTPRQYEGLRFSPSLILGADHQLWEGPGFSAAWLSVHVSSLQAMDPG